MEVRAVLFDTFGTVVDWRGSLIDELSAWGTAAGREVDWTGLVDAWRGAYAPSMDRVRRGELAWTTLDDLHRATLVALLARFGVAGLTPDEVEHLNRGWHRLRPWPDAVSGLAALKRTRVIAPLSNGNVALLVNLAKHAGLPWDMVFSAELFRHYKPDPETYLGACALLSLPPAQVMLCAAHNSDLKAAQALGLRTAFIARPAEYGPAQARDLGPEGDWDVVIAGLGELEGALGRL